jgi:hypothetical protein
MAERLGKSVRHVLRLKRQLTEKGFLSPEPEPTSFRRLAHPVRAGVVYFLAIDEVPGYVKIGCAEDVQARLRDYQRSPVLLPFTLTVIATLSSEDMYRDEALWQERFREKKVCGEWFKLSEEDIAAIKEAMLK